MGISYEDAVKAQRAIEEKLMEDPNVVSIGVVEETDELGQKTGDFSIEVGIKSLEVYQNSLKQGKSLIPPEYTIHPDDDSRRDKHVHICVFKAGKIAALSNTDIPSAVDDIPKAMVVSENTLRRRPSPGGQSIGHPLVTTGTAALLVEYKDGAEKGKAFILSNNHVIAANNRAKLGDGILQPGITDFGLVGKDEIASLHSFVPLDKDGFNYVDAATAEVFGAFSWNKYATPYVTKIGYPEDPTDARMGMSVEKMGRTTGHTEGRIVSINETVKVDYGDTGLIKFKDQIRTTAMSQGGDSGSCLFETGTRKPVGLLFAGGESGTFFNPMGTVLRAVSGCKIGTPFSILKKKFSTTSVLAALQSNARKSSVPLIAVAGVYTASTLLFDFTKGKKDIPSAGSSLTS